MLAQCVDRTCRRTPRRTRLLLPRILAALPSVLLACGPEGLPLEESDDSDLASNEPAQVARWRFNETSGTKINDSSFYGNHGALFGGAGFVPNGSGNALALDGANDYADVPHSSTLNITQQISVSAWVNVKNTGGHHVFVGKPISATAHVAPYFAYALTARYVSPTAVRPHFMVTIGTSRTTAAAATTISTGWHNLTGVYDGASVRIYIDGVLSASTAKTGRIASYPTPVRVGANGARGDRMKGLIDDVRIWSRALSACEVGEITGRRCGGGADGGVADSGGKDASVPPDAGSSTDSGVGTSKIVFNGDFETGNVSQFTPHLATAPAVSFTAVRSPVASGLFAGKFDLPFVSPEADNYRAETYLKDGASNFEFNEEYWFSFDYRFEDWAKDSSAETAPFQVHVRPSQWGCYIGTTWSNAPFYMYVANDVMGFNSYGGINRWSAPIQKNKWLTITVRFIPSWDSDGIIEAWFNGAKIVSVSGKNSARTDGCGGTLRAPYFNMGVYKWDWRVGRPATQSSRRTLLVDSFKLAHGSGGYSVVTSAASR